MDIRSASRIMKTLHFPRLVSHFVLRQFVKCEMKQSIREDRQNDARDNALSSPPEEERIGIHCVWATEFYGPSNRTSLAESLRRLDRRETGNVRSRERLETWLCELDRHQSGVAYRSLGLLKPRGVVFPHGIRNYEVDMPRNVAYGQGTIAYMSPTLIAVVMCFVFDDQYSSRFDEALRQEGQTSGTLRGLGWEIHRPADQKRTAIDEMRKDMAERATSWFQKHIPGIFSSVLEHHSVPTCEFVTVRDAYPFVRADVANGKYPLYLDLLGLTDTHRAWKFSVDSSKSFAIPSQQQEAIRSHSTLAYRLDNSVTGSEAEHLHGLHSQVWPMLITVATVSLMEAYTEQLNRLRNEESSRLQGLGNVKRTLERASKAIGYFPTVGIIADELVKSTSQSFSTIGLVENLCPSSDHDWRKPLLQYLKDTIRDHATWTMETEESFRNTLAQFAQVAGIAEDIRLQRRLLFLTVVVVIFTAIAALPSLPSIVPVFGKAWSFMSKLLNVAGTGVG